TPRSCQDVSMAYLSFLSETDEDARAAVKSAATGDAHTPLIQAEFSMTGEAWKKVADALGELAAREGSELRTDFPGGWTLFWKIREGDSRFFVAHPENEQWVGTLALSESHLALARKFLE